MVPNGQHRGRYNGQSSNNPEIAILFDDTATSTRDIVIKQVDESLTKINELHPSYDSLQYPLLFPFGSPGYHLQSPESCMRHYAYKIMIRKALSDHSAPQPGSFNFKFSHLHAGKSLFQQYLVDMAAKIISERLIYFRTHQQTIRAEAYSNLIDHASSGGNPDDIGRAVRLPSSFFGGPRYMHNKQQDAFAILRRYGKPTFFATLTCNPKWREIKDNVFPGQSAVDRPDIVTRVFSEKQKVYHQILNSFKNLSFFQYLHCPQSNFKGSYHFHVNSQILTEMVQRKRVLGEANGFTWNQEHQKRDLPHTHNLYWIDDFQACGTCLYYFRQYINIQLTFNFYFIFSI